MDQQIVDLFTRAESSPIMAVLIVLALILFIVRAINQRPPRDSMMPDEATGNIASVISTTGKLQEAPWMEVRHLSEAITRQTAELANANRLQAENNNITRDAVMAMTMMATTVSNEVDGLAIAVREGFNRVGQNQHATEQKQEDVYQAVLPLPSQIERIEKALLIHNPHALEDVIAPIVDKAVAGLLSRLDDLEGKLIAKTKRAPRKPKAIDEEKAA